MSDRNDGIWKMALERAVAEALHESEIKVRAMIYYRAAAICLGVGPARDQPNAAQERKEEK